MKKLITASLRDNSSGKRTLFINLRPTVVEELNLKDTPHVEITRLNSDEGDRYRIKFLAKQTARSRKISFKESYAYVGVAPDVFKLTHDEQVSSFPIDADLTGDGYLEFDFDIDEFLKPRASLGETRKINTTADKVAAGFKADTAWGVKFQMDTEEKMEQEIIACMKRKYALPVEEIVSSPKLTLIQDPVDYARVWTGYTTINTKGAK